AGQAATPPGEPTMKWTASPQTKPPGREAPVQRPSREAIARMPEFVGLPLDRIHLVRDEPEAARAWEALARSAHVGFDTESKPVFVRGPPGGGPHVGHLAARAGACTVQL